MDPHVALLSLTAITVLGVSAQWVSWACRIPSILLLLLSGLLLGPVTGWVRPIDLFGNLLLPFTSLSVAIILFEGGLGLQVQKIEGLKNVIFSLVTVGVVVTFGLTSLFLYYVLGFTFTFSVLESAILVVTGPTVIIPMLQSLNIKEPARSLLRWEGIIIDPIGAMAAVLVFEALLQQTTAGAVEVIIEGVVATLGFGLLFGVLAGYLILFILRRYWVSDALQSPMVLMFLVLTFTLANSIQDDAGLVSATVMGIILANQDKVHIGHILNFKENLSIILIAFLFITLTGITDITTLWEHLDESAWLLLFLIVVSRPLSVMIATLFSKISWKDRLLLSCVAPRGIIAAAISSLFALSLSRAGYAEAVLFPPITFTIIAGTVIFYSFFTPYIAKKLGLLSIPDQGLLIIGANTLARSVGEAMDQQGFKVQLIDTNYYKVSETKKSVIPVFHGNFITYEKLHPDGFEGLGKVLAMTESDDVNSLAMIHFGSHFDQKDLYQLPVVSEKISEHLMGRHLFSENLDCFTLEKLLEEGAVIKGTNITAEFTYEDLQEEHQGQIIPLFFISKTGILTPVTTDALASPPSKGKAIYLLIPVA